MSNCLTKELKLCPEGGGKLARILYAMVKHRSPFDPDRLGNLEQNRARKERDLRCQAEGLDFTLIPREQEVS